MVHEAYGLLSPEQVRNIYVHMLTLHHIYKTKDLMYYIEPIYLAKAYQTLIIKKEEYS